jgi:hypothetical protein
VKAGKITWSFFLLSPPVKMEEAEGSETSAYKIQTPGNQPKERIQQSLFILIIVWKMPIYSM